jgi:splicing factor 3A subunit 1
LDTDIIKLTAQYTAVNGREFLAGLAQREIRNPQFDFLKPTHLLFSYFTALVDSYAKILHSASELQSRLLVSSDKMKALELAVQRWVWNKEEAERKYRESAEADSEKIAFNSIDWHDFVVVETINFPQDELFDLPIMPTLGAIPSSLPPPALILNTNGRNGTKRFVEDDMDMDMDDDNIHNPPPSPVLSNSKPTEIYIDDDAMDEDDDVALKVVTDYRPRVAGGATGGPMTMRDPLTGKTVSVDVMSEHMRVALLDPKWRIEQQRFQDKQKETGFAEGSSIADNLKQFAKRRGDIFGHKQIGSSSMEEEEEEEKPETIQWDGHQGSIAAAQQLQRELSMRNPQPVPPPPVPVSNIGPALPSLNTAVVQTLPPAPVLATSTIMGIKVPPPPPVPLTPSVVSGLPIPIPIPIIPSVAPIPVIPAPIIPGVIPMPVMPPIIPSVIPGVIPIPSFPVPVGITQAPPSVPSDVPAKKSKPLEVELISAEEFAAQYPSGVNLRITIPNESSGQGASWGLTGQTFTLTIDITTTIRNVKETVATQAKETGNGTETIPVNRFQLKAGAVFLKDASTLAALNIGDGSILELVVKSRR